MNPNDPYYPDERNSGITQRNKLIFDIYVKSLADYQKEENCARDAIKAADILIEQLKKEEKQ